MIGANSRYTSATLRVDSGPDGLPRQEMRVAFPTARTVTFTYYQVKAGDRVDLLASSFFGAPEMWWVLADANPEILDWMEIPVGTVIRIPSG